MQRWSSALRWSCAADLWLCRTISSISSLFPSSLSCSPAPRLVAMPSSSARNATKRTKSRTYIFVLGSETAQPFRAPRGQLRTQAGPDPDSAPCVWPRNAPQLPAPGKKNRLYVRGAQTYSRSQYCTTCVRILSDPGDRIMLEEGWVRRCSSFRLTAHAQARQVLVRRSKASSKIPV